MAWMFDQKLSPIGTYDAGPGKTWRSTENTRTSSGATMNGGIASRANVPAVAAVSTAWYGRRDAAMASGTATAKATIWEMTISSTSIGKALAIVLTTDWWVTNDWPRSPWRTWPSQTKYCCHSGLS